MERPRIREVTDVAKLGPIGIIKESLKLYWSHAKFYLVILVRDILPTTFAFLSSKLLIPLLSSHFQSKSNLQAAPSPPSFAPGPIAGAKGEQVMFFVGGVTWQALQALSIQALWITPVLYMVGLFYSGNSMPFVDVNLKIYMFKRVMVTWLWEISFTFAVLFLEILLVIGFVFSLGQTEDRIAIWISSVTNLSHIILFVGLSLVFEVAQSVSVLDESYGWAAVKKSLQLLKGNKWCVAVGVIFLSLIPQIPIYLLVTNYTSQVSLHPWNPLVWLEAVIYVACTSLFGELNGVSSGVMNASFKAYHGESIGDSSFFKPMVTDSKDIYDPEQKALGGSKNEPWV